MIAVRRAASRAKLSTRCCAAEARPPPRRLAATTGSRSSTSAAEPARCCSGCARASPGLAPGRRRRQRSDAGDCARRKPGADARSPGRTLDAGRRRCRSGRRFDAVGCFYDALNHLTDTAALARAFGGDGGGAAAGRSAGLRRRPTRSGSTRWWRGNRSSRGDGLAARHRLQLRSPAGSWAGRRRPSRRDGAPAGRSSWPSAASRGQPIRQRAGATPGCDDRSSEPWAPFDGDLAGKTWWMRARTAERMIGSLSAVKSTRQDWPSRESIASNWVVLQRRVDDWPNIVLDGWRNSAVGFGPRSRKRGFPVPSRRSPASLPPTTIPPPPRRRRPPVAPTRLPDRRREADPLPGARGGRVRLRALRRRRDADLRRARSTRRSS